MADIVYINGNYCHASDAKISVFDRGLLFADSVYEVIPVYNGHLFYLEKHLKRLNYSLESARITPPDIQWQSILERLIEQSGGGDMQIYIQVTRGNQGVRKHDIPSQITPTVIAFSMNSDFPTFEEKQKGLKAKLLEDIRWQRCDIKTTALIGNVLLNDDAVSSGADTAILSRNGFLTEGGAANLFLVDQNNIIRTPPLTHFCLPGITRDVVIELIKTLSWPLSEESIPTEAIFNAKEVWISSATKEIYPIIRVNDKLIGDGQAGPYWSQLNEKYQQLIKKLYD
ncbi:MULTISPECIES: D-amino acid aminotransferase [Legionella]|uniref:Aminodeoxychorismate lyase n=1 Tax=Legionella drozanskii LLAP-1 TaxID=1212489 RepID=A0A0W0TDH4_9GAMM|nr:MULTISPECIES: D-amino acid aminotransferase [Legionella]KTC93656.1 D-alanine-aminotransferase [Legionella drozanskii LLAP-1]PJE12688.1 MAG: D-amino acid aminotransferase [Legionella sp.]